MRNRILLTTFLVCSLTNVFAQQASDLATSIELNKKYWHYRNRLRYFVVNGLTVDPSSPGIANVASERNTEPSNKFSRRFISFAEQPMHLGHYIGVLATEYKLLMAVGLELRAEETLTELYNALLAVKRLDECEDGFPWYKWTSSFDGYMNRTDAPWDFAMLYSKELNEGIDPADTLPNLHPGAPTYADYTSSGDPNCFAHQNDPAWDDPFAQFLEQGQISRDMMCHLYIGLALVRKCIPETEIEIHSLNSEIAIAFYNHIYFNNFSIKNPNGDNVSSQQGGGVGGDLIDFAWPLYNATRYITKNSGLYFPPDYSSYLLWESCLMVSPSLNYKDYDHMRCAILSISNDYMSLPLLANNSEERILNISSIHNWTPFYLLLWRCLHDKEYINDYDSYDNSALEMLISAPCEGPYCFHDDIPSGGWASSDRFTNNIMRQNFGDSWFTGNYNGLDFLLLYNLYYLSSHYSAFFYLDYRDLHPGFTPPTNNPILINAYRSITTMQRVMLDADLTLTAGSCVHLTNGFKAETGCRFHAYISKQNCDLSYFNATIFSPEELSLSFQGGILNKSIYERFVNEVDIEQENDSLQVLDVFPNPFSDCFYCGELIGKSYELYNIHSDLINKGLLEEMNCFSWLEPGVYILEIGNDQPITIKLIKL